MIDPVSERRALILFCPDIYTHVIMIRLEGY